MLLDQVSDTSRDARNDLVHGNLKDLLTQEDVTDESGDESSGKGDFGPIRWHQESADHSTYWPSDSDSKLIKNDILIQKRELAILAAQKLMPCGSTQIDVDDEEEEEETGSGKGIFGGLRWSHNPAAIRKSGLDNGKIKLIEEQLSDRVRIDRNKVVHGDLSRLAWALEYSRQKSLGTEVFLPDVLVASIEGLHRDWGPIWAYVYDKAICRQPNNHQTAEARGQVNCQGQECEAWLMLKKFTTQLC